LKPPEKNSWVRHWFNNYQTINFPPGQFNLELPQYQT